MSEICEEGVKEAQATGDLEIAAQFLYSSGVYQYLSIEPVDLGRVRCDVTQCLQTLGRVVELSQSGHQLECRASLLLAEVSMGGDATPMIGVYRGVGRMLDEQVNDYMYCTYYSEHVHVYSVHVHVDNTNCPVTCTLYVCTNVHVHV